MEKVISHMRRHNLLGNNQYGFVSGRSTTLQLLRVLDEWTAILDGRDDIDVMYMDFMKAFDKVPHRRLLAKLRMYGVTGQVHGWIKEFLSHRKQRVLVNGAESEWKDVISGKPQGTILGPVLFIIYINDLPEEINSGMFLFADDAKIFRSVTNEDDMKLLQQDIKSLQEWTEKWHLKLHPDKCKIMHLSGTRIDHEEHDYILESGSGFRSHN
jgi:hypothetical protein